LLSLLRQGLTIDEVSLKLVRSFKSVVGRITRLRKLGNVISVTAPPRGKGVDRHLLGRPMMLADDLAWDLETLAALLAREEFPEASLWRLELIKFAQRCDQIRSELCARRGCPAKGVRDD
jgi:hypothetical protein